MDYKEPSTQGKMMKKLIVPLVVMSLFAMAAASFAQCGGVSKATAEASAALCSKCGEVAGSDKCCAEGAEACAGCGLHKGSPGCAAKCAAPAAPAEAVPAS